LEFNGKKANNFYGLKFFWHSICTIFAQILSLLTFGKYILNNIFMKVKIKPLADRVLVAPAEAEQKTAGGIIIPDTAKEKPQKGTVIEVGPGKKDEPMTVKTGDTVLYGKYSGTELQLDGENYLIMKESDIYAII
jgi:chaperonin GroES